MYIYQDAGGVAGTLDISAYTGLDIVNGQNFQIGGLAASLLNCDLALPRIFNYALSPGQIYQMFEKERRLFGV